MFRVHSNDFRRKELQSGQPPALVACGSEREVPSEVQTKRRKGQDVDFRIKTDRFGGIN